MQTCDSCFIGNISKIIVWMDYLYISDREDRMFLFDSSGKFIRTIGVKGRGAGEYIGIGDFPVNPENGDLYIMSMDKMLVYGFDGLLKKESKVDTALQVGMFDSNGNRVFISPMGSGLPDPFPLIYVCGEQGGILNQLNGRGDHPGAGGTGAAVDERAGERVIWDERIMG